ncbi:MULTISPECIES: hypothetical protein [Haloarcula]|uniref:hypothetical protein n=1 Tax=Haloarcula TaxID=2237 RepID=UPI0023EE03EA|nr:hypothetical protein [Halomicroarcula sp. XH51]
MDNDGPSVYCKACNEGHRYDDLVDAREVGVGADLRTEGTPTSMYIEELRESDEQFIAVLDEVAVLDEESLLALYEVPNVSLICITIDEHLVHFFEVLRESPEELVEWLSTVPYSRVHEQRHERSAKETQEHPLVNLDPRDVARQVDPAIGNPTGSFRDPPNGAGVEL